MIVRQSPAGTALHRAMEPETYRWGLAEQLLATNADLLNEANWQRQGDANTPHPEPFPRSDEVPPPPVDQGVSLEEANRRLGWAKPPEGASS